MRRIERQRTKGWRMPPGGIYVGRPTEWGNPFVVGEDVHLQSCLGGELLCIHLDDAAAVLAFRLYAEQRAARSPDWLAPLRGRNLACWCELDRPCHADVLLELANR